MVVPSPHTCRHWCKTMYNSAFRSRLGLQVVGKFLKDRAQNTGVDSQGFLETLLHFGGEQRLGARGAKKLRSRDREGAPSLAFGRRGTHLQPRWCSCSRLRWKGRGNPLMNGATAGGTWCVCCWWGVCYILLNVVLKYTEHKIYPFYVYNSMTLIYPPYCATVITSHLQNFLITWNRNSVPIKQWLPMSSSSSPWW